VLRHVLVFTGLSCLVGFFHPGLAPLIAARLLGPSPQALGWFTSVLAAGSVSGGLVLQRYSQGLSRRPTLLLGGCTALLGLGMSFLIGAGTACLLAGTNMISQVGAPQVLRGRMAGLGQIAFLGGGGVSGLLAALLTLRLGMPSCFALLGLAGLAMGVWELSRSRLRLEPA
jgi:hypothetical protein